MMGYHRCWAHGAWLAQGMIMRCQGCLQGAAPPPPPPDEPDQEHSASQKEAIFIQRMNDSIKVPPSSRKLTTRLSANNKIQLGRCMLAGIVSR